MNAIRSGTSNSLINGPAELTIGLNYLTGVDADLDRIHRELGPPPIWPREPGFPTLVHIILEQQVSLASARAAFDRLSATIAPVTPEKFLLLNDRELLRIGFSRQKAGYCRYLAETLVRKEIDLDALALDPDDAAVRSELIKLRGIGAWTADIYLLMALRRRDIWPVGDLALAVALREVKRLEDRPGTEEMERIAEAWKPYRAVAARVLWHYYLNSPQRKRGPRRSGSHSVGGVAERR